MDDTLLSKILAEVPESLSDEIKALSQDTLIYFTRLVDESDYSVRDWGEALVAFTAWEKQHQQFLDFIDKVDYLNCCVEGSLASGGKLLPLVDAFQDYVKLYGVEKGSSR